MPNLYVISGCNGAGKTTVSFTVLPQILNCKEFVNADEIARGLSPFQPQNVAIQAGKIMLNRIDELIRLGNDFAFETTLSTKSYKNKIEQAQKAGYFVTIIYFWLNSVELAIERVRRRVAEGGHDIPVEVIERRYNTGLKNLINIFIPITDYWMIVDNSKNPFSLIAEGSKIEEKVIYENVKWEKIIEIVNG